MKSLLFSYATFLLVLMAFCLAIPAFPFSTAVATGIATICVVKRARDLSILALCLIGALVSDALPIATWFWITNGHNMSLTDYLLPTSYQNLSNDLELILPVLVIIAIIQAARRLAPASHPANNSPAAGNV